LIRSKVRPQRQHRRSVRHLRMILGDIGTIAQAGPRAVRWATDCGRRSISCRKFGQGGATGSALLRGGIATPPNAALVMQLGAQSVFVGSGIFKSSDPAKRARAIVERPRTSPTPTSSPRCRASRRSDAREEIGSLDVKLATALVTL